MPTAHIFTDACGRRWGIVVTPAQAQAVRSGTGIDLERLLADGMRHLSALLDDSQGRRWVPVVTALCASQIAHAGMTAEQFAQVLSDPETGEYACGALCQALLDAYRPGEGYKVRQTKRFDRAMARIVDRGTRKEFDTRRQEDK